MVAKKKLHKSNGIMDGYVYLEKKEAKRGKK